MNHGQVAYEGYCKHTGNKSLISGAELPPWDALDSKIQEAWLAAAKAATGCVNVPVSDVARKAFEEHVESGRQTKNNS